MGSHFLFTTVYVPPELVPYLESYAYITLLTKINFIILVTLKEHWCLFLTVSISKCPKHLGKNLKKGRQNFSSCQGSQDPRILGLLDPRIIRSQDCWILGLQDPRIVGSQDCRILGLQDPRIVGSQDCWILGLLDPRIVGS